MTLAVPTAAAERPQPDPVRVADDVARALAEDIGSGDATADLLPAEGRATAVLTCRDEAVLAGTAWFDACFRQLDPQAAIRWLASDGDRIAADSVICEVRGNARALVTAERSALNFLQLLSATATVTARYVEAVAGTRTRILDTRKTVPGLRVAQKYAVLCGGGTNHRAGLFDAILIKENHILAAGGIAQAVAAGRQRHPGLLLEVEAETIDELTQAIDAGVDRVMLDNFGHEALLAAVTLAAGRVSLEVSGNVELDALPRIAATGVDFISTGAITKHVHAVDLSLRLRLE
jgi:nicotinate-nucleotide pyrophosphorylase (carboxylating)